MRRMQEHTVGSHLPLIISQLHYKRLPMTAPESHLPHFTGSTALPTFLSRESPFSSSLAALHRSNNARRGEDLHGGRLSAEAHQCPY